MPLRTEINPGYLIRLAIVSSACLFMCLWSLYDGLVAYPNQRKHALEYQDFADAHPELDKKELYDQWDETARQTHGWLVGKNDLEKPRSAYDINSQFVMAVVTGLIGLFFLWKLLRNRGRWIEADEQGLRSSEGREVAFDAIHALNKKLWQNKGIAKVIYAIHGKKQKIVLDDCNYVRDTTQAILRHVEANIDHAFIVNGKPEPPSSPEEP